MYDGSGDGWGGSMITISSEDETLFNGTLNNGNYEVNYIQIGDSEPCEETIYGCEYESEIYSFLFEHLTLNLSGKQLKH